MYKIGIDTGGTFTDGVLFDEGGEIKIFKAPTTPEDFSIGVLNCLEEAASGLKLKLREFLGRVDLIAHGTTITTNACIVSSGAKVGTISTKGFRDILELRRGMRPAHYYKKTAEAPVLSPRYLREEVEERVLPNGEINIRLNEDDVRRAIKKFKEYSVEAIAVTLLFSFLNPKHEKRIAEIISEEYPAVYVALSSEVLPQVREFERTSTTVLDAYVGPILIKYLTKLHERLKKENFNGELLLMQSNGGVQRWDTALKRPLGSINSGPAAAFPASLYFAEMMDTEDILSVDMGGTSFDVGLIKNRTINTTTEGWTGQQRNAIPMADILAIGAGGGSIAWVDPNGILRVGPQSAGSDPGPACYGKRGVEPTVTDANVILGCLNPDNFLGGKLTLDVDAARKALNKIADQLGIDIIEVADAIYNVVNENMINAINLAAIRRGYDPQDFLLVVGGGTGAIHTVSLAQKLNISRILIPKQSPVYCAFGLLLSDLKHNYVQSHIAPLRSADLNFVNSLFEEMESEGSKNLRKEGVSPENIFFRRSADMRYLGQYKEVEIDFPGNSLGPEDIESIEKLFSDKHQHLFAFSDPSRELEILTLKVEAIGKTPRPSIKRKPIEGKNPDQALKGRRSVYFTEVKDFLDTNIYNGDFLEPGNIIEGPAVVEERALTLVVPPKFKFKVDQYGNYISSQ